MKLIMSKIKELEKEIIRSLLTGKSYTETAKALNMQVLRVRQLFKSGLQRYSNILDEENRIPVQERTLEAALKNKKYWLSQINKK